MYPNPQVKPTGRDITPCTLRNDLLSGSSVPTPSMDSWTGQSGESITSAVEVDSDYTSASRKDNRRLYQLIRQSDGIPRPESFAKGLNQQVHRADTRNTDYNKRNNIQPPRFTLVRNQQLDRKICCDDHHRSAIHQQDLEDSDSIKNEEDADDNPWQCKPNEENHLIQQPIPEKDLCYLASPTVARRFSSKVVRKMLTPVHSHGLTRKVAPRPMSKRRAGSRRGFCPQGVDDPSSLDMKSNLRRISQEQFNHEKISCRAVPRPLVEAKRSISHCRNCCCSRKENKDNRQIIETHDNDFTLNRYFNDTGRIYLGNAKKYIPDVEDYQLLADSQDIVRRRSSRTPPSHAWFREPDKDQAPTMDTLDDSEMDTTDSEEEQSIRQLEANDLMFIRFVGTAMFGHVLLAAEEKSNQVVIIKSVSKRRLRMKLNSHEVDNFENPLMEMCLSTHLFSVNNKIKPFFIVKPYGIMESPSHLFLIQEYVENGELFDLVRKSKPLTEESTKLVALQLLLAVYSLHENGLCHRDISLENVLVKKDGSVRLIDFGQAACVYEPNGDRKLLFGKAGKAYYRAPEMYVGQYFGAPVDIFALGVLLFILLTSFPPWEEATMRDSRYRMAISSGRDVGILLHSFVKTDNFTPELRDFLTGMLLKPAEIRPSAHTLLHHEWLWTGPAWDQVLQYYNYQENIVALKNEIMNKCPI